MHKKMLAALALVAAVAVGACDDGNGDTTTPVPADASPAAENGAEAPAGDDAAATPLPEDGAEAPAGEDAEAPAGDDEAATPLPEGE